MRVLWNGQSCLRRKGGITGAFFHAPRKRNIKYIQTVIGSIYDTRTPSLANPPIQMTPPRTSFTDLLQGEGSARPKMFNKSRLKVELIALLLSLLFWFFLIICLPHLFNYLNKYSGFSCHKFLLSIYQYYQQVPLIILISKMFHKWQTWHNNMDTYFKLPLLLV